MIPPSQILIQLLYYGTVGEERRHANVRVVGWRAALLRCGEQAMDKERDMRDARSETRVLNSGQIQAQPIKGCSIAFDHRGHYLPFYASVGCPCQVHSHPSPDGHAIGTGQRSSSSANVPFFFLIASPRVGFESSHVSTHTCLSWCNVQKLDVIQS